MILSFIREGLELANMCSKCKSAHPNSICCGVETPAVGHPHASLMAEYAKDALTSKEPWKDWQWRMVRESGNDSGAGWCALQTSPTWGTGNEYRRKPKKRTASCRTLLVRYPSEVPNKPAHRTTYTTTDFGGDKSLWERKVGDPIYVGSSGIVVQIHDYTMEYDE